jgi:hypothetical protein
MHHPDVSVVLKDEMQQQGFKHFGKFEGHYHDFRIGIVECRTVGPDETNVLCKLDGGGVEGDNRRRENKRRQQGEGTRGEERTENKKREIALHWLQPVPPPHPPLPVAQWRICSSSSIGPELC